MAKTRERTNKRRHALPLPAFDSTPLVSFSLKTKKQFSFDAVLGADSTQEDVYQVSEDERERRERREKNKNEREEQERRRDASRPRPLDGRPSPLSQPSFPPPPFSSRQAGASDVVIGALDGYNGTVLAYGQTGSGKTHTMIGEFIVKERKEKRRKWLLTDKRRVEANKPG